MVAIRHEAVCHAPLPVVFAYIDDYRTAPSWMFGLSAFTPVDPARTEGVGAEFDGTFAVPPVSLTSRVRMVEREPDALIALDSVTGFRNSSRWSFRAEGSARTRMTVEFEYTLPGGLAGRLLGRALEPVVALSVRRTDAALRANIEAEYAGRRAGRG